MFGALGGLVARTYWTRLPFTIPLTCEGDALCVPAHAVEHCRCKRGGVCAGVLDMRPFVGAAGIRNLCKMSTNATQFATSDLCGPAHFDVSSGLPPAGRCAKISCNV